MKQRVPLLQSLEPKGHQVLDIRGDGDDLDFEYLIVNSTIIGTHQYALGAKNEAGD
mgnify:CR=1 FL=1